MKNKKYKTRYSSIVPREQIGICVDVTNTYVNALKIEFPNGECFWFLKRDLQEVTE